MSFWTMSLVPILFTAGMTLMDTTDSLLMAGPYGRAFVNPNRKLSYNLEITAASVILAVFIGGIEALDLIVEKLSLEGCIFNLVSAVNQNLTNFGYVVVENSIVSWIFSIAFYRARGYDQLLAT